MTENLNVKELADGLGKLTREQLEAEVVSLRLKLDNMKRREESILAAIPYHVTDGGQYVADIAAAISRIVEDGDAFRKVATDVWGYLALMPLDEPTLDKFPEVQSARKYRQAIYDAIRDTQKRHPAMEKRVKR